MYVNRYGRFFQIVDIEFHFSVFVVVVVVVVVFFKLRV